MKQAVTFPAVLLLAVAASAATVQIDPASTIMAGTGALNVRITDVVDLYAWQFDLAFDPVLLAANAASEGAFLSGGGTTFFSVITLDNTTGTVTLLNTLIGPEPGVSGSGTLATIHFVALSAGTSAITLSNIVLLDSILGDIPADVRNGSVTAVPGAVIPEPNSGFLLASVSGLALVGRCCLRRSPSRG